jgi:putative ABC transport system ATP-binding protein
MQPIISLKNVSVVYNKGEASESVALNDISLDIFEGEYVVFFGPSGCGKSTLLYTIAGLEVPTVGEVSVGGTNLQAIKPNDLIEFYRTTIGMIFQAFYLVSHLTAKDNMMLSQMFSGVTKDEREKKANELCERFGISAFADRKPSMMSGGQQQRTAIARALMNNPSIILADEPVGNLDSKNAEIVLELLSDVHSKEKKTVIQVTHNSRDTHYADRVFYIKDGRIERVVTQSHKGEQPAQASESVLAKHVDVESSDLAKLKVVNPHMSETTLKAMLIMRHVLLPYTLDVEQKIVLAIEQFVKGKIDRAELAALLDDPRTGAGLYSQKAYHTAEAVECLMRRLSTKASEELNESSENRAKRIVESLIASYGGDMTSEQFDRLNACVLERVKGLLSPAETFRILDIPHSEGGVGLNSRTARHFADTINLMLS